MPALPVTLTIKPGVDTQSTPFQSLGQLSESNLIRSENGFIQKLGGCTRLSSDAFDGVATAVMPWAALDTTQYVGIGTTTHLELLASAVIVDITPAAGVGTGDWSLDKWGENLVAAPAGGTIYEWTPPVAFANIALPVLNAPPVVNGLIVAAPQQQIIAWGAYSATLGTQDPLLAAWCDVADNTLWIAAPTNQAGTFRIPQGSEIVAIMWPGISGLLWTDLDLWTMTYVGFPLIYGFNNLAQGAGLISRRAVAQLGSRVVWMTQNDFMLYQGGSVQKLTCTVRDFIFDNLDRNFDGNIHAAANTYFDEATWWFPMIGSAGVCTGYVKWKATDNTWDYGSGGPDISAWSDESIIGAPIGTDYGGLIQQFETALDWDGVPFNSGFLSGWFYLQEGEVNIFVERIMPDFTINAGGEISLSILFADEIPQTATDYPVRTYGPYTVTASTPLIIVRGSGRVARIRIECTAPNTSWRYGKPIARVSIDGRR